jgi:hypothetical protein
MAGRSKMAKRATHQPWQQQHDMMPTIEISGTTISSSSTLFEMPSAPK